MQKNKILLLTLRGNIIGDSVREIALAKKLLSENNNSEIIYPCGKIIFDLLNNNKFLKAIYIKELDILNKNKNILIKIYFLLIAFIKILKISKNIKLVNYSGQKNILRYNLAKFLAFIKNSKFQHQGFESALGYTAELNFEKKEDENIEKYLVKNNKKNISICIESTDINRMWDKNNFIKLIEKLKNDYNIYLLGIDKNYNQEISDKLGNDIVNLVGLLNIRETSLIIKNSYLYTGNDSGLAHIASSVETNIIIITIKNTINKNFVFNNKNKTFLKIVKNPDINNLILKINENSIHSM